MSKHTKGPWRVFGDTVESKYKKIATAYKAPSTTHEELVDNLYLVAAAPEILDALEQVEKSFNVKTISALEAFAVLERVRYLIKKARGEK